jgi:predicted ferric reductase
LPLPASKRRLLGGLGILVLAGLVAAAITVPVVNHSREAEAFGSAAARIITFGKACGVVAGLLILVQLILAAKLASLDRVYAANRVLALHPWTGTTALALAILHPFLVYAPKNVETGVLRWELWPQVLGAGLLFSLGMAAAVAMRRGWLRLPYHRWAPLHRLGGVALAIGVFIHAAAAALPASPPTTDLFSGWGPRAVLFGAAGIYFAILLWANWVRPRQAGNNAYRVASVESVGRDTHAVALVPPDGGTLSYAPGQFALVTFLAEPLPRERHPWTISSTPTRPDRLVFTIKCSGDFTRQVGRLEPGHTAAVLGPYGLFTHLALELQPTAPLIMIAGGVGVTPMLSMLRYLADTGDKRKILLVWGNRTEEDILYRDEWGKLEQALDLTVQHVLSEQDVFPGGRTGFVDRGLLGDVLTGIPRDTHVFLCGPPPMMDAADQNLRELGFSKKRIHTERFSF